MKAGVVVFPGSNCDRDVQIALQQAGYDVQMLWHKESSIPKLDLVVLPGGFSYGDYLRCGSMAANSTIISAIVEHANAGRKLLGICNGFQVLAEAKLLPGALLRNRDLKFICSEQNLRVESNNSDFTKKYKIGDVVKFPIAHHDGNFFAQQDAIKSIEDNGQIVFKYCDAGGNVSQQSNPNGSIQNIAGISNKKGNILGLMPHPERVISSLLGGDDGKVFFDNIAA